MQGFGVQFAKAAGLAAIGLAAALAGCASMNGDGARSLADTANVLGVPEADLTIVSSRYDAAAGADGYTLTDYTVATRDGTTYLCIVDAGQRQADVHNRPVCRRQDARFKL